MHVQRAPSHITADMASAQPALEGVPSMHSPTAAHLQQETGLPSSTSHTQGRHWSFALRGNAAHNSNPMHVLGRLRPLPGASLWLTQQRLMQQQHTHSHIRCWRAHKPVAGAAAATAAGRSVHAMLLPCAPRTLATCPTTQVLSHPLGPVWEHCLETIHQLVADQAPSKSHTPLLSTGHVCCCCCRYQATAPADNVANTATPGCCLTLVVAQRAACAPKCRSSHSFWPCRNPPVIT